MRFSFALLSKTYSRMLKVVVLISYFFQKISHISKCKQYLNHIFFSEKYDTRMFMINSCLIGRLAPKREAAGLSIRRMPTSGLAWSLYKCAALWRAVNGASATLCNYLCTDGNFFSGFLLFIELLVQPDHWICIVKFCVISNNACLHASRLCNMYKFTWRK